MKRKTSFFETELKAMMITSMRTEVSIIALALLMASLTALSGAHAAELTSDKLKMPSPNIVLPENALKRAKPFISPKEISTGLLEFNGFAASKEITTGLLEFNGFAASKEITTGQLEFNGLAAPKEISTGQLEFNGRAASVTTSPPLMVTPVTTLMQGAKSPLQQVQGGNAGPILPPKR